MLPIEPDPTKEVEQSQKLSALRDAVEKARDKKDAAKKVVDELTKKIDDWWNWLLRFTEYGYSGPTYSAACGGIGYQHTYTPYVSTSTCLNEADLISWEARGKSVWTALKKKLKEQETTYNKRVKEYEKAVKKYEEALAKAGIQTRVDTTTIEGINSASEGKPSTGSREGAGGGGRGSTDGNTTSDPSEFVLKGADARKVKINFNIPMVKSAYYGYSEDQIQMQQVLHPNWVLKNNGRKMWFKGQAGKGVIQPDLNAAAFALSSAYKNTKAVVKNLNNKIYGFRFLYNPNKISMQWGISTEVDPVFESLGLDKAVPLTGNITNGEISFSVLLNRIEDMNHIDQVGWKRKEASGGGFDQVNNVGVYPTYVNTNPWPTTADPLTFNEDLKEIYNRGTLYDLDFLFAALMPGSPKYRSNLNGVISDRGFMSGYVCELHLGPGMRYKVQIKSVYVDHIIFDERMVPLLSEVSINASRLPDIKTEATKDGIKVPS